MNLVDSLKTLKATKNNKWKHTKYEHQYIKFNIKIRLSPWKHKIKLIFIHLHSVVALLFNTFTSGHVSTRTIIDHNNNNVCKTNVGVDYCVTCLVF